MSTDIQTITGKYFDYANFDVNDIDETDVSYALSNICRFNGHCTEHYSVAKHLCLVHDLMEYSSIHLNHPVNPEHIFHGLIHDVGEAYLTDIPRPLKNYFAIIPEFGEFMKNYNKLEDKIITLFSRKFGHNDHDSEMANAVKFYDRWALRIEQRHIMKNTPRKWDNESIDFPEDPPFVKEYFKKRSIWEWDNEPSWSEEFLKRLKCHIKN